MEEEHQEIEQEVTHENKEPEAMNIE